jgi:hypothetical protein
MRNLLAAAMLSAAICATGWPSPAAPSISVEDALKMCEAGFLPPHDQAASASCRNACVAYIDGVVATVAQIAAMADVAKSARHGPGRRIVFCIPGDEPYERLSKVFIRFARANPQHKERAAAAIFVAAFAAAYPCD